MPLRLFAAAWGYELASWFAFLSVISWLEAAGGARLSGLYFVLYNGVQLPAAALLAPVLDRAERGRLLRLVVALPAAFLLLLLVQRELWAGLFLGAAFALSDYLLYTLVPSAVPLLVPAERLSRANALWQAGSGVIFVLAPAASGAFLERFGVFSGFYVAGGLLALALLLAAGLFVGRPEEKGARGGWREVLAHPLALWAAAAVFFVALGGGVVNAALPVLTGGGRDYGLLLSALGTGGLLASLVFTRVQLFRPLRLAFAAVIFHAGGDLALALGRGIAVYLPAGFFKGIANSIFSLGLDTELQRRLPAGVLARAFSLGWAAGNLGQVLGSGAVALWAAALGVRTLLLAAALIGLSALLPLLRTGERPSPQLPGPGGRRGP